MLPLRFPRLWLGLGWALIALVCLGSLMPSSDIPSIGVSDKIQHATAYLLLTLWFAGLYPRSRYLWLGLAMFGLGVALDLLQLTTATRHFDLYDVLADLIGVLIAVAIAYAGIGGWCLRTERVLGLQR